MIRNQSIPVSTVDGVEFVNLAPSDISPMVSKCEIKVMYLGKNRNGSYIDKPTAIEMAKTLRSVPIVGAYKEDIRDFGDHGEVLTIEDGEIKFSCKTVPYGFVAPDADVWFQKFEDTNEFGEVDVREYMMTTGYLWTGQFPEANRVIEQGNGQSMEIDINDGHWAQDQNEMEFFIINDAVFTKLCILGDDVEPCFEGASVTSPEVSETFSNEKKFTRTLFAMMNELKNALNEGESMSVENAVVESAENEVMETEEFAAEEPAIEDGNETTEEFAADEEKKDDQEDEGEEPESDDVDEPEDKDDEKSDEEDKKSEKAALQSQVEELSSALGELTEKFSALEAEAKELREFKAARINEDKDALIAKYHMLSDEDKAEIVADKDKFTLSEIESKLALLYVRKNVDFETVDGHAESAEPAPLTTFSLNDDFAETVDPMLSALREAKNL